MVCKKGRVNVKRILKPIEVRIKTWWRRGDSQRVQSLWLGMKADPVCAVCGEPYTAHGWMEGVGIVHPGDVIVDLPGQSVVLRPDVAAAVMEDEENDQKGA
jgi:hypothetical protein